jgi:hypothetical protein
MQIDHEVDHGCGRVGGLDGAQRVTLSPDDRFVYAVSGGSLARLGALPHVGASVDWGDGTRLERLVARLTAEVAGRREALSRHGGTLADWWAADDADAAPPPVLLLVDDWELVGAELEQLGPDVVALQEVREAPGKVANQAATLAARLGFAHERGPRPTQATQPGVSANSTTSAR